MNSIIIIGNLTKDPEMHTTQNGKNRCNFTVAVPRKAPNAQGVREADFINCIAWNQRADFISKYFSKGKKIALEGTLQVRSYDAQDGSKRTISEVVVENVEFVTPRDRNEGSAGTAVQSVDEDDRPDEMTEADDSDLPF